MSSLFRSGVFFFVFTLPALAATLKVCADPDNLPYSSKSGSGFENHLARLIGSGLHEQVQFVWARPRRGFVRERVNKGECDVLMSVPVGMRGVLASKPYLRSSYVFVTRSVRNLDISSFDDPRLKKMKIGVQTLDDEYAPPAQALGKRGMLTNIVGYEPFGKIPGKIISDVGAGKLDTAVVWGPLAGYYARRSRKKLTLTPVQPDHEGALPFAYDLAVGVAKSKPELLERINRVLAQKHREIALLLTSYGIPQLNSREVMEARR
jgi:mxaJ protein